MTPVTGLRLLAEEELIAALEDHLVPRLTTLLARRFSGHCMRLDDIEAPLAVRLCRRLRSATRAQVHVLGEPPAVPDDLAASSTKIVELRNPDADGALRPPLLVFVPPGTRASAEDSFGVATFEQIALGRVYADLAAELLCRLPPDVARGIEDLFAVLDTERWPTADARSRCRYLLTVALNDHDEQAAGGAVFEVGLVPDPDLFSSRVASRATHNVRTVAQLSESLKPERQRVLALGLTDSSFRRELAEFAVQAGLSEPARWTRQIVAERDNWKFFFGQWPLREDTTYDEVDIEVGELDLPMAGTGEHDAADPVLRGITGQRYLPVGVAGLKDLVVPFRLGQDPRQVPALARFRVQIMAEDAEAAGTEHPGGTPTEISTTVKASRTAKQDYRGRLRRLQQSAWEEGWYYVRVTALDTDGLPMAHGREADADRGHPSHESDRFYVIPDGDHEGPVEQRKHRAAGVIQAARTLEATAVAEGRDVGSVAYRSSRWQDPPRGSGGAITERTLVCDFGSEGLVDVALSPHLAGIEQRILADPVDAGHWQLSLSVAGATGAVAPATREENRPLSSVDVGSWAAFLEARAELFEHISRPLSGSEGTPVEGCDLLAVHDEVIRYADSYLALLGRQHGVVAERSDSHGGEALATLAELARIDTVTVALTDHREVTHEVVLVAPTHPLRLLWLTTWARVGREWATTGDASDRGAVRAAADALRRLEPLGFPLVIPRPGGRLAIAAFDLTPYWGACLPDATGDPQGLLALLQTALRVPDRSTLSDVWSGTALADRLEHYRRQHPYAQTLLLNAVNVGRGDEIAQAIKLVRARSGLGAVSFDLRLYAADPEAPGTAEAVVELLEGDDPMAGLAVSVRARREFGKDIRVDAAHLTVLFDALSAEQHGTALDPDREPLPALPVHGLVQEMVTDYDEDRDATVWRKRPKHGIAPELAGAEEATDLLSTLPKMISAVAATLAAGHFVEHQVPEISLSLTADDSGLLDHAHRCSDWVITVDRTLGIEFFDNAQGLQRPDYVIDYAPDTGTALGHHMVVSSRSLDELRILLAPMLAENGLLVLEHHVRTFFTHLRLLSGRLAFKIASVAGSQRAEVLGLALARMYLDYQGALENQILVPLDAHLDLYREPRAGADAQGIVADLHRTDLALFDLEPARRTITCRLVEVKCFTSDSGIGGHQRVRERIRTQIDRSSAVIAGHFDPAIMRPDRAMKNYELANLLRFYLDRGRRYGAIAADAASSVERLIDHLDDGYRLEFTRSGLVFDLGGTGWDIETEGGIEFSRIGRDLVQELLDAVPTGPLPEGASSGRLSDASLQVPRPGSGAFHSAPRQGAAHDAEEPPSTRADPTAVPPAAEVGASVTDSSPIAPTAAPPVGDPPTATDRADDPGTGGDDMAGSVAGARGDEGSGGPPVEPDIIVGTSRSSPQFGILGEAHGRSIALDLDETHTVSLFGVQGGGKSYTLGSIIESATIPTPPLNRLISPLATIVFHYSATQDYAPEFTSMVAPNDDPAARARLWDTFGVEPRGLSDVVLLVPRDQCEKRRAEYPGLDVRPLVFSSAELQATHWRFLMGAVGNQATYIRQLTRIMRNHRDDLQMDTIRGAVEGSGLAEHLKQLALQRLDLASDYIDDSTRLGDVVLPGRLIIVDLRDELIEKDEALGLFVVMMQLFADAHGEAGRFNKLVVFDEAHKYIDSPDLVKGLVESVREMRHKGMSVLVASQDPPSVPVSLIELSDHIIVHKFTSPAWLKHLQKANAALSTVTADRLAELKPGEAYLWAGKSTDPVFTQRMVKIRTRPRLTRHGGATRTATGG